MFFLPKYSPDLNSIGQVFSNPKHLLRKAQARSCDAVLNTIERTLNTYAPDECANYLQNSGLESSNPNPLKNPLLARIVTGHGAEAPQPPRGHHHKRPALPPDRLQPQARPFAASQVAISVATCSAPGSSMIQCAWSAYSR